MMYITLRGILATTIVITYMPASEDHTMKNRSRWKTINSYRAKGTKDQYSDLERIPDSYNQQQTQEDKSWEHTQCTQTARQYCNPQKT